MLSICQVKYEGRGGGGGGGGEGEARSSTYASLQPVTSVHGGYAYAGQSPQYAAAGYGAYAAPGKEQLLTLYGAGGGTRGEESPPGQLLYRSDPTLSSSSLARGAHVVYGSVVPQSQAAYDAPPSPNSQQVRRTSVPVSYSDDPLERCDEPTMCVPRR